MAKPISEASSEVKTEPKAARETADSIHSALHKGGNLHSIRSLEASQSLPVSTAPPTLPENENRVKKFVTVESGDTMISLCLRYYQRANITLLDKILELNPGITNPHLILVNKEIRIPEITEASLVIPSPDGTCKVHLGTFSRPEYADSYRDDPVLKGRSIEVIARKISSQETWYRIMAGKFETRAEALTALRTLKEKGLLPIPQQKE